MMSQQSTIFPKQIKIDDYESSQNNHLIILQSSNLLLGSGSRTSTAAIVLAKALQNMDDQGDIKFQGKSVFDLGCGVGLVGLFLSVLGAKVGLCDTPAIKDLVERNIKINRQMLKGKTQFFIASWYLFNQKRRKLNCIGDCKQSLKSQTVSTSSSNKAKQTCLFHLVKDYDFTIVCQCGGMNDLENQLAFMGKEGMILAFMIRENWEDGLDKRTVQEYLNEKSYEYQIIDSYHPDYVDNRVVIFRIYPLTISKEQGEQIKKNESQSNTEIINQKVQKLQL